MRWRWLPIVGLAFVLTTTVTGQTAANNVSTTRAEDDQRAATPNDLKPDPPCGAITVTAKITGSGTITGTNAAELITGGPGVDNIDGGGGDDCIVGGGGNDSVRGGAGTDVCIGGIGTDSMHPSCETAIQ